MRLRRRLGIECRALLGGDARAQLVHCGGDAIKVCLEEPGGRVVVARGGRFDVELKGGHDERRVL